MEHGDRPEPTLAEPRRELLGHDDRAVKPARTADRNREPALALRDVGRDGELEKAAQRIEELGRERLVEDIGADRVRQPGLRAQLVDVERVLHEANVEDEVGLEWHAKLVAEADELD